MEKKLLALLLMIPIVSIYITWSVFNISNVTQTRISFPQKNSDDKVADTFFNHATILNFGENGLPKSRVIGEQIFHYPGDEDSKIVSPKITLFRDTGTPVHISADYGWINHEGTRVLLKGHTIIHRKQSQANQFSQLETPELTVWPNKDYAETDKAVKIITASTVATGVGMKAYLDTEHYYLLNQVKAKHIPVKGSQE